MMSRIKRLLVWFVLYVLGYNVVFYLLAYFMDFFDNGIDSPMFDTALVFFCAGTFVGAIGSYFCLECFDD